MCLPACRWHLRTGAHEGTVVNINAASQRPLGPDPARRLECEPEPRAGLSIR